MEWPKGNVCKEIVFSFGKSEILTGNPKSLREFSKPIKENVIPLRKSQHLTGIPKGL
jgi:hypothetical protein